MTVPFLDLSAAYKELKSDIDAAVSRVMASGWYILGPEVEAFEAEFADYCNARSAVGVANGLEALVLALRAFHIGPGDEVLVPSNTFVATWLAVSRVGAKPVPVEPDAGTFNLDAGLLPAAVTPRTKAIIAVHLYGQPAELDKIRAFANDHKLVLIEDAAQAHGSKFRGQRIGGHGDAVCWSFYPTKNLGAMGDGGAITTNHPTIAERIRIDANYGSRKKYYNEVLGTNSRLDALQAAILRVKLRKLDEWNERRRRIADLYLENLKGDLIALPAVPSWVDPVWHLFVIRSSNRERLREKLEAAGVGAQVHYPVAPHEQEAYRHSGAAFPPLPIAEALAKEVLSLPIGPHQSAEQTNKVIEAMNENV